MFYDDLMMCDVCLSISRCLETQENEIVESVRDSALGFEPYN